MNLFTKTAKTLCVTQLSVTVKINSKEERRILTRGFKGFSPLLAVPIAFRPVVREKGSTC
jgi:hypothetical protein